ncbi:MAG: hypothetical protein J1E02_05610 [Coprobacter sp.]|nr:hypothetical protein [Coprobacter sp.]
MSENVYLIQFCYDGIENSIPFLSYCDFSKVDVSVLAEHIEDYIQSCGIHKEDAKVTNVRLFGKDGELIIKVDDFSQL